MARILNALPISRPLFLYLNSREFFQNLYNGSSGIPLISSVEILSQARGMVVWANPCRIGAFASGLRRIRLPGGRPVLSPPPTELPRECGLIKWSCFRKYFTEINRINRSDLLHAQIGARARVGA